jgi:hypothetical protein
MHWTPPAQSRLFRHENANARIAAMVQCSGLPWNGKRR